MLPTITGYTIINEIKTLDDLQAELEKQIEEQEKINKAVVETKDLIAQQKMNLINLLKEYSKTLKKEINGGFDKNGELHWD